MKKLLLLFVLVPFIFISCDDDKKIGYGDLPSVSKTFIETHFGGATVRLVEEDNDSYDVYFNNGYEVDFFKDGAWKSVDGNYQELPQSFLNIEPVNKILEYVTAQYPNHFVTEVSFEKGRNEYDVDLNNDVELVFNSDGSFKRVDY